MEEEGYSYKEDKELLEELKLNPTDVRRALELQRFSVKRHHFIQLIQSPELQ